jgi:hypothetical protein
MEAQKLTGKYQIVTYAFRMADEAKHQAGVTPAREDPSQSGDAQGLGPWGFNKISFHLGNQVRGVRWLK